MIGNIDDNFGKLLEHLDELQIRDNTLIFFIGDNGSQQPRYIAGLRGRKSWVYEGGIRVPCFVQWPKAIPGKRRLETIGAHIDILPTILDVCEIARPENLDGQSLKSLLMNMGEMPADRTLFFQCHRGLTPHKFQNCAVVTQQFKLVGYPGTFGKETLATSSDAPKLELYDIPADPAEEHDLAAMRPKVTRRLRKAYENWFADVEATRQFRPGRIMIDMRHENPCLLCRYQDSNFRDGLPYGWSVEIAESRLYEVHIERGDLNGPVELHVTWQGMQTTQSLEADSSSAKFPLTAGTGLLDIWLQQPGRSRTRIGIGNNGTAGNVTLTAEKSRG